MNRQTWKTRPSEKENSVKLGNIGIEQRLGFFFDKPITEEAEANCETQRNWSGIGAKGTRSDRSNRSVNSVKKKTNKKNSVNSVKGTYRRRS